METRRNPGPIVVFDGGIGSYAIVKLLQEKAPARDVVYIADRQSFPYGQKTSDQLYHSVKNVIDFAETYNPSAIIVASNAPSVILKDKLQGMSEVPIFGILPPVKEALDKSTSKHIAVLGVQSLASSEQGQAIVDEYSKEGNTVHLHNASPLIENLVETGKFVTDEKQTQTDVSAFMTDLMSMVPKIDVCTLSSTHLPWLKPFFENTKKNCTFIDPAESVVEDILKSLPQVDTNREGQVTGFVTDNPEYPIDDFRRLFEVIDPKLTLKIVNIHERLRSDQESREADDITETTRLLQQAQMQVAPEVPVGAETRERGTWRRQGLQAVRGAGGKILQVARELSCCSRG
jgi:glutamate racemase